jgi:hypothetical protein
MVQDIVHYLRTGGHCSRAVRGAILQVLFCMAFFFTFCEQIVPAQKPVSEGLLEI